MVYSTYFTLISLLFANFAGKTSNKTSVSNGPSVLQRKRQNYWKKTKRKISHEYGGRKNGADHCLAYEVNLFVLTRSLFFFFNGKSAPKSEMRRSGIVFA